VGGSYTYVEKERKTTATGMLVPTPPPKKVEKGMYRGRLSYRRGNAWVHSGEGENSEEGGFAGMKFTRGARVQVG